MQKVTHEQVLIWFGDDTREDIAKYIASTLNNIAREENSKIAKDLIEEIVELSGGANEEN